MIINQVEDVVRANLEVFGAEDSNNKTLWLHQLYYLARSVTSGRADFDSFLDIEFREIPGQTSSYTAEIVGLNCKNTRYAPSLVSRCDSELYGICSPRFSFRIYFGSSGFVNVRRASLLEKSLRNKNAPTVNATIIGDCFFAIPERLTTESYFILATDYWAAYGEEPRCKGSPFIQCGNLVTGECSQATTFMATLLLNKYAKGVYGMAEMSALLASEGGPVVIGPLTPPEIDSYLRMPQVGLSLAKEKVPAYPVLIEEHNSAQTQEQMLALAMQAYLKSGFPIIFPVDKNRMCGYGVFAPDNVYKKNFPDAYPKPLLGDSASHHHMVLVIGFKPSETRPPEHHFVFHDPQALPFLTITAKDMIAVGCYLTPTKSEKRIKGLFYPVIPKSIKLPLLNIVDDTRTLCFGVAVISYYTRSMLENVRDFVSGELYLDSFQLVDLMDPTTYPVNLEPFIEQVKANEGARSLNRWMWLQSIGETLLFWDAEKRPISRRQFKDEIDFQAELYSYCCGIFGEDQS
ncbi:MAG: hypothetical protein U1F77_06825 [Kiritimatiellia bacterium]